MKQTAKDILIENSLLITMPTYDIARVVELRVNKYSVISIDENKYSVPDLRVNL